MKKILLSLGAIATISTPVIVVVSCGTHDDLPGEKNVARSLLNGSDLSVDQVNEFNKRINAAGSVSEVSKIRKEIESQSEIVREQSSSLNAHRGNAILEVEAFSYLDSEKINEYKSKINEATSADGISAIISLAQNENSAIRLKGDLERDVRSDLSDKDMASELFLLNDYNEGVEAMKAAKSVDQLNAARDALVAKRNHPSISKATKDGWIIAADEAEKGLKLYLPNENIGTKVIWTDVSLKTDQKTVIYEVTGVDDSSCPIIDVTIDGVSQVDKATVDQLDIKDYGIVLNDFSGSYHVSGVKALGDFKTNQDVITFLKRSEPVLHSRYAKLIDIDGMKDFLKSTWPLDPSSKDYSNLIFDKDGKLEIS